MPLKLTFYGKETILYVPKIIDKFILILGFTLLLPLTILEFVTQFFIERIIRCMELLLSKKPYEIREDE